MVRADLCPERYRPSVTFNELAELCAQGQDPPEETGNTAGGPCPFLKDNECSIYPVRPFGCRCMVSKQNCQETGYADMDPWVLSVNNVFLQYIEHVDQYGFSGNLTDVLIFMAAKENRRRYSSNELFNLPAFLIANRPISILMIPPEHRQKIEPILKALSQ
jgi:Fe-S-cluster containining protein